MLCFALFQYQLKLITSVVKEQFQITWVMQIKWPERKSTHMINIYSILYCYCIVYLKFVFPFSIHMSFALIEQNFKSSRYIYIFKPQKCSENLIELNVQKKKLNIGLNKAAIYKSHTYVQAYISVYICI